MAFGGTLVRSRLMVGDCSHLVPPVIGSDNAHRSIGTHRAASTAKQATSPDVRTSPADFSIWNPYSVAARRFPLMVFGKPGTDHWCGKDFPR
jgi:hypothetical protein